MFENPRRGRQARNFTTNVPKILDLKSSSEQIFFENCRWVPLSLAMECLSPRCISGAMCGNLFIDFSMFNLGLRNLALTILQLFPKSIITGLFSDPSMTTLLVFRSLCKKPLSWMNISISHVCFKIFAHMVTSLIEFLFPERFHYAKRGSGEPDKMVPDLWKHQTEEGFPTGLQFQ